MKAILIMLIMGLVLPTAHAAPRSAQPSPGIGLNQHAKPLSKPEIVSRLKSIQERYTTAIQNSEQSMRKLIQESQNIKIGPDQVSAERQLQSLTKRLQATISEKEELQLRYDFIGQLIFQIDSKWGSQPLAKFLEYQLLEMAITEITSASKSDLWRFYMNLSIAIRELPEKREDLVGFVDGYVEFSSMREPKSPVQYLNTRNYTNGAINQTARPVTREQLNAAVEKQLKELESLNPPPATSSGTTVDSSDAIELRTQAPETRESN